MGIGQAISELPAPNELVAAARLLLMPRAAVRARVSTTEARGILQQRLAHRERDFLSLAWDSIYGQPGGVYHTLLQAAGCQFGDLERLVGQDGLEGALQTLYSKGVYLTLDELKGRHPAVRGSITIPVSQSQLRNPSITSYVGLRRGASRAPETLMPLDLASERERIVNRQLVVAARSEWEWEHAHWSVPGGTAINFPLILIVNGLSAARSFTQVDYHDPHLHPRYRWSMRVLRWGGWLAGTSIPAPQHVPLTDPLPIAHWMTDVLSHGGTPHLTTYPSPAVRLCQAALSEGIDLTGAWFSLGGEPMTTARRQVIREAGAEIMTSYSASEAGNLGRGCATPRAPDDTHFFHDLHAVIQPGTAHPTDGLPPGALLLTSLRRGARFILLNTSLGDQAELTTRPCDCPLNNVGWTSHLSNIRSFAKLTAVGMTFHDVELIHVLEVDLPQRFGGGPTDFQLVEDVEEDSRPRVRLVVHPRLGPLDAAEVRSAFLDAIGAGSGAQRVMAIAWRDNGIPEVVRDAPRVTATGKILHVHLVRSPELP